MTDADAGMRTRRPFPAPVFPKPATWPLLLVAALLTGCSGVYYGAMEKLGYEKRDILVDRVDDARESQQEAREQFESALEQFIATTGFEGGDLEAQYRRLKSEYDASVTRADDVRRRIDQVESVADDLFAEWQRELDLYTDAALRRASAAQLRDTQSRYRQLLGAMRRAESKIEPVLNAFRDRVLFLKHNLNAQAIASLRADRRKIETDIAALVQEMNRSIEAADGFIQAMGRS